MLRIVTDEGEWNAVHARTIASSVQASYAYLAAGAGLEPGGRAELAVWQRGDAFVMHPYVRRRVPLDPAYDDLISVFEFGGFWFSTADRGARQDLLAGFETAFAAHAAETGIVSEFVRFHPFSGNGDLGFAVYNVVVACDNIVVDLRRPYDDIWNGFHRSRRNKVRQGREHGLAADADLGFDTFVDIYYRNLRALGAHEKYFFPLAFFEDVAFCLDVCCVREPGGDVCAAHVYLLDGDVAFAFLCQGVPEKLSLRPNDFAYDAMIRSLQSRGIRTLHLGGGVESLRHYKATFSDDRVPYPIGRVVFDAEAYGRLTDAFVRETGRPAPTHFFPAYRGMELNAPPPTRAKTDLSRPPREPGEAP